MTDIKFKFAAGKALTAIHYLVCEQPEIDLHTLLKTCYLADKEHMRKHTRPVFGAEYKAMRFGPVPLEIYEMAKGENYWLAELGLEEFPWMLRGYRLALRHPLMNKCQPDMSNLSDSDIEEIRVAHSYCRELNFDARTEATHQADWHTARLGRMRYEDMLIGVDDYQEKVEYLKEAGHKLRL